MQKVTRKNLARIDAFLAPVEPIVVYDYSFIDASEGKIMVRLETGDGYIDYLTFYMGDEQREKTTWFKPDDNTAIDVLENPDYIFKYLFLNSPKK